MSHETEPGEICTPESIETDTLVLGSLYLILGIVAGFIALIMNNAAYLWSQGEEVPLLQLILFNPDAYPEIDFTEVPTWIGPVNESVIFLAMFALGIVVFVGITKTLDDRLPCLNLGRHWWKFPIVLGFSFGLFEALSYSQFLGDQPLIWARLFSLVAHPIFAVIIAFGILRSLHDWRIRNCEWDRILTTLLLAIAAHWAVNVYVMPWLIEEWPWLLNEVPI